MLSGSVSLKFFRQRLDTGDEPVSNFVVQQYVHFYSHQFLCRLRPRPMLTEDDLKRKSGKTCKALQVMALSCLQQ
jgi:hypothetical protein